MAPPGRVIAGYRVHLTAATAAAEGSGDLQAGLAPGSLLGPPLVTAGCLAADCVFGDPGDPLADANLVTASGLPNPALALVAVCGSPWACQGDNDKAVAEARLWRSAVDVLDEEAPQLGRRPARCWAPAPSPAGPRSARRQATLVAASLMCRCGSTGLQVARTAVGGTCSRP